MCLPSPGKFILLLAKLHAETQVAAKIPNGEEKPQCQFVYLLQTSVCAVTSDALLLGTFPCCMPPSCPQSPTKPRGKVVPAELVPSAHGQCQQPDVACLQLGRLPRGTGTAPPWWHRQG